MLTLKKNTVDENTAVLHLSGDATVENVAELHQALIEGLNEFEHLQIDCTNASGIDFFAIQLLCSAHRAAVFRNKRLKFVGKPPAALIETIQLTGFARHRGCILCPEGEICLWL